EAVYDAALAHYNRKREALAQPFFNSIQEIVNRDDEKKPERLFVDFTDGRKMMRVVVRPEDVVATKGQEVNDGLERAAVLTTIDSRWTEHLRDLDEVKEGIGLRAYGQKDPLIEYKMEAFKLFAAMMEEIQEEAVSIVFKAGPLVEGKRVQTQAAAPKSRLDRSRAQTQKESKEGYGVNTGGNGSAAERDPTAAPEPVVVEKEPGR